MNPTGTDLAVTWRKLFVNHVTLEHGINGDTSAYGTKLTADLARRPVCTAIGSTSGFGGSIRKKRLLRKRSSLRTVISIKINMLFILSICVTFMARLTEAQVETNSTASPTTTPTTKPIQIFSPTKRPTTSPTNTPTKSPSSSPTNSPTKIPTTKSPTKPPTKSPSSSPTNNPTTSSPTNNPTTSSPTKTPSKSPSLSPTSAPTTSSPTKTPSKSPSSLPTETPSNSPSSSPSHRPSGVPTLKHSDRPSNTPTNYPSFAPSYVPTNVPSSTPSDTPSHAPSSPPTGAPSHSPTLLPSMSPTHKPSMSPTVTHTGVPSLTINPTSNPSAHPSNSPSSSPTVTLNPSASPTMVPSKTPTHFPSTSPSIAPTISKQPTSNPSASPSSRPSYKNEFVDSLEFEQELSGPSLLRMNNSQEFYFQTLYASYTKHYSDLYVDVDTICDVIKQRELVGVKPTFVVSYNMIYKSRLIDLTNLTFPQMFLEWMGNETNRDGVMVDLNKDDIKVTTLKEAKGFFPEPPTPIPTPMPTRQHTLNPSQSISNIPSIKPSSIPSTYPSYSPTQLPSTYPSYSPTRLTQLPVAPPTNEAGTIARNAIIGASAGAGFLFIVIVSTFWFFTRRRRRRRKELAHGVPFNDSEDLNSRPPENINKINPESNLYPGGNVVSADSEDSPSQQIPNSMNQQESLYPHPSNVSDDFSYQSNSDLDEQDCTHQIADEFDQYKNQNLEKMRAEVEENITNVDDMMSIALTKALMDDPFNSEYMSWARSLDSMEIEASVLCETNDWLKRKEGAITEEKRSFMQEMINKMVACVGFGVLAPEHGSRAIHGSAALLGLQLAGELPETTIIITSMRKKAKRENVFNAFKEFGEIEGSAVSPNNRGFGIVRYKSPKSVLKALERARTDEIVVQDVSVNIRLLKATVTNVPNRGASEATRYNMGEDMHMRGRGAGAMEAHHHPALEAIGYPDDSLGRVSASGRSSRPNPSSNQPPYSESDESESIHSSNRSHSHNYRRRR